MLEQHAGATLAGLQDILTGKYLVRRHDKAACRREQLLGLQAYRMQLVVDQVDHAANLVFGNDRSLANLQEERLESFVTRREAAQAAKRKRRAAQAKRSVCFQGEAAVAGFEAAVGFDMDEYAMLPRRTPEQVRGGRSPCFSRPSCSSRLMAAAPCRRRRLERAERRDQRD
jgi:hypothetical protein